MTELKNRGVEDILIAVVDGLKGFPEAIAAVFPPTIVQTCIVHLIRNSMDFASWKDRKPIAAELKAIYRATDTDVARRALEDFDAGVWGRRSPAIAQSWPAQLGACHPVLRLSRRCAAHHLHHDNDYCILERQTAARRANERPFSNR